MASAKKRRKKDPPAKPKKSKDLPQPGPGRRIPRALDASPSRRRPIPEKGRHAIGDVVGLESIRIRQGRISLQVRVRVTSRPFQDAPLRDRVLTATVEGRTVEPGDLVMIAKKPDSTEGPSKWIIEQVFRGRHHKKTPPVGAKRPRISVRFPVD